MGNIELYFFKLRTGEQVLALLGGMTTDEEDEPESILMVDPVSFQIIPDQGPWMQHYLMLADDKQIQLSVEEVMFAVPASETAHKYYNRFFEKYEGDRGMNQTTKRPSGDGPSDTSSDMEYEEELDDETLQALLESSKAIKH